MKFTRYFLEQIQVRRPYINIDDCLEVIANPLSISIQIDGRKRHWGKVIDLRDGKTRVLRVVTLEDGETIHNAFYDRDYSEDEK